MHFSTWKYQQVTNKQDGTSMYSLPREDKVRMQLPQKRSSAKID